jgi:hypothetical protein
MRFNPEVLWSCKKKDLPATGKQSLGNGYIALNRPSAKYLLAKYVTGAPRKESDAALCGGYRQRRGNQPIRAHRAFTLLPACVLRIQEQPDKLVRVMAPCDEQGAPLIILER